MLYRWRAWAAVARDGGGVHPGGTEYVAEPDDPRVLADRSRCLGPAETVPVLADEPAPDAVAAAFDQWPD